MHTIATYIMILFMTYIDNIIPICKDSMKPLRTACLYKFSMVAGTEWWCAPMAIMNIVAVVRSCRHHIIDSCHDTCSQQAHK